MNVKQIRKLKRKKRYNANVNRKRLRNKLQKLPNISCPEIKQEWETEKSTRLNLKDMGLAYDANEAVGIFSDMKQRLERVKRQSLTSEDSSKHEDEAAHAIFGKNHVAEALESAARTARQRLLRLPKAQAQFLTYLINKYGEDYEAMSRDKKNHYQLTWKQIRAKIQLFKGIPNQYKEYFQDVQN